MMNQNKNKENAHMLAFTHFIITISFILFFNLYNLNLAITKNIFYLN